MLGIRRNSNCRSCRSRCSRRWGTASPTRRSIRKERSTDAARDAPARGGLSGGLGVIEVCGLSADSRAIAPGFVFFAIPGNKADGTRYIEAALARGAVAIVAERQPAEPTGCIAFILVDDVRRALALAAAAFYPRQPETIVAITGTSGKTSVAAFCRQIWTRLGSSGLDGNARHRRARRRHLWRPDDPRPDRPASEPRWPRARRRHPPRARSLIAWDRAEAARRRQAERGRFHQSVPRPSRLSRDAGNLSQSEAPPVRDAARARRSRGGQCRQRCRGRCPGGLRGARLQAVTVGKAGRSLRLIDSRPEDLAQSLSLEVEGRPLRARLPLAGDFQISNALVAAGLCIATGSEPEAVLAALDTLEGAPGRLQLVGRRGTAPVFVDYAHKPDALDKVLATLRPLAKGRLSVVFGCGGDRDQGKRPIMGEIAARLADRVVVTDDNPRSEAPAAIRAAILEGTGAGRAEVVEVGDRAAAIDTAVASLLPGDVLVIAGKGHETAQIVGDRVLPFSDLDCALTALQNHPA